LTPGAYHNLAESVRGKVSYEAAEKCYAAVEAACLAKNSKLMKGAMPDPVRIVLFHYNMLRCMLLEAITVSGGARRIGYFVLI